MSHPGDHKTLHGLLLTSLYTVHTNLTDRTIGYGGMVQRSDTYCNPLAYQIRKCLLGSQVSALLNPSAHTVCCLLYTSDAADDLLCVDLGGRRIIKKKKKQKIIEKARH